jgi:hypothetical protein
MGDPNVHNHRRCPLVLLGHAGGKLKGNLHLKYADGAPMANALLSVAHILDINLPSLGDSTEPFDLNAVPPSPTAAQG